MIQKCSGFLCGFIKHPCKSGCLKLCGNIVYMAFSVDVFCDSRRKVQDIVSDVGYSDASHFIVMFKKLTGMTPAQFRKLHI